MAQKTNIMTAKQLKDFLTDLENQGHNLELVSLNFREDYNSDIVEIEEVEEDLFDESTNSILESIVFISNTEEV
jgi:hypothetical protein